MKNNLRSYLFDLLHSRSPDFKNVFILFAHKKNERESKDAKENGKNECFSSHKLFSQLYTEQATDNGGEIVTSLNEAQSFRSLRL